MTTPTIPGFTRFVGNKKSASHPIPLAILVPLIIFHHPPPYHCRNVGFEMSGMCRGRSLHLSWWCVLTVCRSRIDILPSFIPVICPNPKVRRLTKLLPHLRHSTTKGYLSHNCGIAGSHPDASSAAISWHAGQLPSAMPMSGRSAISSSRVCATCCPAG